MKSTIARVLQLDSSKVPNRIPSDCAIELYKDASCNTLEAVFDWGIDQGGKSVKRDFWRMGFAWSGCGCANS